MTLITLLDRVLIIQDIEHLPSVYFLRIIRVLRIVGLSIYSILQTAQRSLSSDDIFSSGVLLTA